MMSGSIQGFDISGPSKRGAAANIDRIGIPIAHRRSGRHAQHIGRKGIPE
jgi:hypothetical protein